VHFNVDNERRSYPVDWLRDGWKDTRTEYVGNETQESRSEAITDQLSPVMDQVSRISGVAKRGFVKGSIIVSCDSFRRFWWPPVPGMSTSYLSWEC